MTEIRRTIKGGLLLQLDMNGERTEDFRGAIGEFLGESASVRTLKVRTTVQIKDIDVIMEKQDIYDVIRSSASLEGISNTDIVALRRAYGGTQTAIVSVDADAAAMLLVKCRIRRIK